MRLVYNLFQGEWQPLIMTSLKTKWISVFMDLMGLVLFRQNGFISSYRLLDITNYIDCVHAL